MEKVCCIIGCCDDNYSKLDLVSLCIENIIKYTGVNTFLFRGDGKFNKFSHSLVSLKALKSNNIKRILFDDEKFIKKKYDYEKEYVINASGGCLILDNIIVYQDRTLVTKTRALYIKYPYKY